MRYVFVDLGVVMGYFGAIGMSGVVRLCFEVIHSPEFTVFGCRGESCFGGMLS